MVLQRIDSAMMNGETVQLSRYDHLLKQVENLKLENSTLKKELVTNTSHIRSLESEASSLKEMVLMLGNSINQQPTLSSQESQSQSNNVPGRVGFFDFEEMAASSRHPPVVPHAGLVSCDPLGQAAMHYPAAEIRQQINNLQAQRSAILESLKREELNKERYMKKLNNMNDKLNNMLDNKQPFSPTTEQTRQYLEAGILEIREMMEKDLGSPAMMQQRIQEWLREIQKIEHEIFKLYNQLFHTENQLKSLSYPLCDQSPSSRKSHETDSGVVERDEVFHLGSSFLCHISTQTPKCSSSFKATNQESTDAPTPADSAKRAWSRSIQTQQTCFVISSPSNLEPDNSNSQFSSGVGDALLSYSLPSNSVSGAITNQEMGTADLFSKLGSNNPEEMSRTFHSLSLSVDSSRAMRHGGCLPLLVQLLHDGSLLPDGAGPPPGKEEVNKGREIRKIASQALRNIVASGTNEEKAIMEFQILSHLEVIREHSEALYQHIIFFSNKAPPKQSSTNQEDFKQSETAQQPHSPLPTISDRLLKSVQTVLQMLYHKPIREAVNDLGGLFCAAELLVLDHHLAKHWADNSPAQDRSRHLRHYAGLIIINLTFGHCANKTIVIKMNGLLDAIIDQLESDSEEIQQSMASILRNLSWQADEQVQEVLRQKGVVKKLMKCVIHVKREDTLKSTLNALWNLSGHCPQNREDICSIDGALAFLVSTLTYHSPSKTEHVVESGSGILRNVTSVITRNAEYRKILRKYNCLQHLLTQLASPSLTIVSNACGALWNLSAMDETDQQTLWDLGAVGKLRTLIHSKHEVISRGSSAALRNLLTNRPAKFSSMLLNGESSKTDMPSLKVRKFKQLETELNQVTSLKPSELSENFSPRHHAQHPSSKQQSSSLHQSMQGQHSSAKLKSQPGIHSSGSLGNLHQTAPRRPIPAWEAAGKMNNTLPIKSSTDVLRASSDKSRTIHSCSINESPYRAGMESSTASQLPPAFSNHPNNTTLHPSYDANGVKPPVYHSRSRSDFKAARTWSHNGSMPNLNNNNTTVDTTAWQSKDSKSSTSSSNSSKILSPSQMPTDLVEKLRHVNDDYSMQEDDDMPVDYSLKFTDEQSRTPAIQSPRAQNAVVYENRSKSLPSQVPNTKFANSGKPSNSASSTSVCHTRRITDAPRSTDKVHGGSKIPTHPKIDPSVEQRILYADDEIFETDETPTNFGAIYAEEQLYEHLPVADEYMMQRYPEVVDSAQVKVANPVSSIEVQERVKHYHVEDTPICFSTRSSLSDLHCDTNDQHTSAQAKPTDSKMDEHTDHINNIEEPNDLNDFTNEEDDKFETQPGAITPGPYFTKSARHSGIMTPRTPFYQDTPMMYSPSSSRSSLDSCDAHSIHSDVTSEPGSRMLSGMISPSELPDSPGQSMPVSRCRSPSTLQESSREMKKFPVHAASSANLQNIPAKKVLDKNAINQNTAPTKPPLTSISGPQFVEKAHAMHTGYLATLNRPDEVKRYNEEPAMSVITSFSELTIDDEKVGPLCSKPFGQEEEEYTKEDDGKQKIQDTKETGRPKDSSKLKDAGSRAIMQAGYVTSLPTNDEIKHFVCEGSLSPMTSLSEISALQSHNQGFQKKSGSPVKVRCSAASNRNSYASRSSATGASVPLPPISQQAQPSSTEGNEELKKSSSCETTELSANASSSLHSPDGNISNLEQTEENKSDFSDFSDSSSDDNDGLLQKYIELAMPKKKSSKGASGKNTKSSSKGKPSSSSSSKQEASTQAEKSITSTHELKSQEQPNMLNMNKHSETMKDKEPEMTSKARKPFDTGYITSLPTTDETKTFNTNGTFSPMTCLSEISALNSHNGGFERSEAHEVKDKLSGMPTSSQTVDNVSRTNTASSGVFIPSNDSSKKMRKGVTDLKNDNASNNANAEQTDADEVEENSSLDDLFDSSSDDNDLLEQYIQLAIPRKKSSSRTNGSKSTKSNSSSSRNKEKTQSRKSTPSKSSKPSLKNSQSSTANRNSGQRVSNHVRKYDTSERIAAANNRLNGMDILQYIENKMSSVPAADDSSGELAKETIPSKPEEKEEIIANGQRSRHIMKTVETLGHSYSVKKQLRTTDKVDVSDKATSWEPASSTDSFVNSSIPMMSNKSKVQAFLQSRPTTYNTEGTPIEMSRSTSLSNLTVESGTENYNFSALQNRAAEKQLHLSISNQPSTPSKQMSEKLNASSSDPMKLSTAPIPGELTNDSEAILVELGQQITNMTLSTVDQIASRADAGYMSSLPHADEIKKFNAEGSVSGHTTFSALTIDSDTKVTPCDPDLTNLGILTSRNLITSGVAGKKAEDKHVSHAQSTRPELPQSNDVGNAVDDLAEDASICRTGNNSSLSSIDIDSDGDANDLLNACISSAIPDPKRDPAAALPPRQLLLSQSNNPSYQGQQPSSSTTANATINAKNFHSPCDDDWDIVHRGANAAAASLVQKQQLNAISPLSLVSMSSPDQPSTSFSLSAGPNTQTSDGFYRLSQQPSIGDSNTSDASVGSMVLGDDAKSLMKSQKQSHPRIVKGKPSSELSSSENRPVAVKGGKKVYRSPITGKVRENLHCPNRSKINSSSDSSSARCKEKRNRNSGSSKSPCNKCYPSHSRHLPISASMGKLEDVPPGRSDRHPMSNSSKQMASGCGVTHDQRKPVRSRSAHSGYQPYITQLYPPMRQINMNGGNAMLNGVVTMAARGDMVLAQCDGQSTQFVPVTIAGQYVTPVGTRPILLKQGTFIQEEPSPALLRSVSRHSQANKAGNGKPQSSKKLKKPGGSASSGKSKMSWKGLKKLLSPNEENKTITESSQGKSSRKGQAEKSNSSLSEKKSDHSKDSDESPPKINSNTWTKSKGHKDPKTPSVSSEPSSSKEVKTSKIPRHAPPLSSNRLSSLSLSSSSASNASSGSLDTFRQKPEAGKTIYPTVSSIKNIPKSPSSKARMLVNKSPSSKSSANALKPGVVSTTINSKPSTSSTSQNWKISLESNSSVTSSSTHARKVAPKSLSGSRQSSATSLSSNNQSLKGRKPSFSVAPGQIVSARSLNEVQESSTKLSQGDVGRNFTSPLRRVVQEVAPFNYRPSKRPSVPSDLETYDHDKLQQYLNQTAV
ncbi:uncharacterized protein LOC143460114 isoform X2 [Clavelina lepadiformis]|uniref:uncharacterized protein LOC143460114 isoform X2 n=1 Tax=Clavelina lepadiformis TaxID=159417 RepID=UPI004041A380